MQTNSDSKVPHETVYSELYNEMRRYRDYELTAATWYTVILVALLGFIISAKYGADDSLAKFVQICAVQGSTVLISTILGVSSCYSVWYADRRYRAIRKIVDEHLEPKWVQEAFKPILSQKAIRPRCFIYLVQLLLVVATWFAVLVPKY